MARSGVLAPWSVPMFRPALKFTVAAAVAQVAAVPGVESAIVIAKL